MEQTIVDSVQLGGSVDTDLSIVGLFLAADPVVKVVMLGLIIVSIFTWAIIFDKILKLRGLRAHARAFEDSFWSGGSIEELYDNVGTNPHDPMSLVFSEAMREWRNSKDLARKSAEVSASLRQMNYRELALGTNSRSGEQWKPGGRCCRRTGR